MNNEQLKVTEFHKIFGLTSNSRPIIPNSKDIQLRINLIQEEANEFEDASLNKDMIEVADALADLLYVVYGAAVTYGIDLEEVFNEVHRSNMSKALPDGTIQRREVDGKIIKPETYSPADIECIIDRQMNNGIHDI